MDQVILEVVAALNAVESVSLSDNSCYIQQGNYSIEITPQYYGYCVMVCDQNANFVACHLTDDDQHEKDYDLDISLFKCSSSSKEALWNAFDEFCKRFALVK